jgi:hypothetical protein
LSSDDVSWPETRLPGAMADEGGKPTDEGAEDPGVLAALPATRPSRLSRRAREGQAPAAPRKAGSGASPAKATGKAKPASRKAAKETPTAAKAESAAAAAGATSSGAKAKPAPSRARGGKAAAKPAPRKTAPKAAEPTPLAAATEKRPRPVRAGHPRLAEPAQKAAVEKRTAAKGSSGTDLVRTVVQAAGELVHVGATIGGQIVKRAVDKLPRP